MCNSFFKEFVMVVQCIRLTQLRFNGYRYDFLSNLDGPMGMVPAALLVMSGSL